MVINTVIPTVIILQLVMKYYSYNYLHKPCASMLSILSHQTSNYLAQDMLHVPNGLAPIYIYTTSIPAAGGWLLVYDRSYILLIKKTRLPVITVVGQHPRLKG